MIRSTMHSYLSSTTKENEMKTWEVEYSTNFEDRHYTTVEAETYTLAYLEFSIKYPHSVVSIKEKERN